MLPAGRRLASLLTIFAIASLLLAQTAIGRRAAAHPQRSRHDRIAYSAHVCHPFATTAQERARYASRASRRRHRAHRHSGESRQLRQRHHIRASRRAKAASNSQRHNRASCARAHASKHRATSPPVNTSPPTISGTPTPGSKLTASRGSWASVQRLHYTYQWLRNGVSISGASSSSYSVSTADADTRVSVRITAASPAGSSAVSTSAALSIAAPPSPREGAQAPTAAESPQMSSPSESAPSPSSTPTEGTATQTLPESASSPEIPTGPEVDPAPFGPPTPAGGWHIAFADAFGAKLGYGPGEDNFWFTNKQEPANTDQPGLNANELEVFNSNADRVGPEGLELLETYTPNAGGTGKNYVGGLVNTALHAQGQQPFSWKSGGATTWAFECVCKWPQNTGGADPGWWSDATVNGQENEIDFFEGFGWGNTWHTDGEWSASMPTVVGLNDHTVYGVERYLGFTPTSGFHRYTTTLAPHGSRTLVSEYVDGIFRWSFEVEYPANRKTFAHLVLSNAMREFSEGFSAGSRAFDIRSVAVYQDGAHAGQEIEGGGIAPGTVVR